jgi:hypothetical protein
MPEQTRIVTPGPDSQSVRTASGDILRPPTGWVLVPPGDAALTRRLKAAGPTWTVQQNRGRKTFSLGLWAPQCTVVAIKLQLAAERAAPGHARRKVADAQRRENVQTEYVQTFREAVLNFLAFHPRYAELAQQLAQAVTEHATPVGSGTVARTSRIPVERRAEAAAIAWMRHQTTAYDELKVPRVKGQRCEVRRLLAQQSKALLDAYRRGHDRDGLNCPLQKALS